MILLKINNKTDRIIAYAITSLLLLPGFNYYANNILILRLGMPSISLIIYGILMLLSLWGSIKAVKNKLCSKKIYTWVIIFIVLTIVSYLFYGDSIGNILISSDFNPLYSQALYLCMLCLPALILGYSCRDWGTVITLLSILSPFIVVIAFIAYFLTGFSTWGEGTMDYMSLSYYILTAGCVCIYNVLNNGRLVHLPFAILSLFIILAAGCRGALVCILGFIFIQIIHQLRVSPNSRNTKYLKVGIFVIIMLFTFGIIGNIEVIATWFDRIGISSRSVSMLTESSFLEDNARDGIRKVVWRGIEENPFGYGLFGDRYITFKYYIGGAEYSHNFLYEIWAEFGLLLGSILLIVIFLRLTKLYFIKFNNPSFSMMVILIPYGIFRLFFSGTYLNDIEFFMLMGLIFNIKNLNIYNKLK